MFAQVQLFTMHCFAAICILQMLQLLVSVLADVLHCFLALRGEPAEGGVGKHLWAVARRC